MIVLEILAITLAALFVLSIVTWRLRWAVFIQTGDLPAILLTNHADWPRGFRWVPRRWFAWLGWPPRKLFGNAEGHLDITEPGTWAMAWPAFVSVRTKSGWTARCGFRWDYNDLYYQLSATVKKL